MGYDRNDCWMTCGERDDKVEEYTLGMFGDPWSEINRLRALVIGAGLCWKCDIKIKPPFCQVDGCPINGPDR